MIPLGPYRPDLGPLSGTCQVANNVLVQSDGTSVKYGPKPTLAAAPGATALPDAPRGAIAAVLNSGTFKAFIATVDTIYELQSDYSFSSIGTGYAVPDEDDESMMRYGDFLLINNTVDGFRQYNMESPGVVSVVSGAPKARFIFTSGNVVIALDCDGDNRVMRNSAFNDHTNWATGGADYQVFEDGQALTGGADLANGAAVVFQENAVRLMRFGSAGGGALYSLTKIADGVGAVHYRSIAGHNGRVFFLHSDGFYMTDGSAPVPIGSEKITRTFLANINASDLTSVSAAIDPVRTMVWWRYKSKSCSSDTVFNDLIGYNWVLKEWVTATEQTAAIFRMATPGYSLEDLDVFGTLDTLPYSLDSRFYQGGAPNMAGLTADLKFGFMDGPAAAATLETASIQDALARLYTSVTPLTDAATATIQIGVGDNANAALTFKQASSIQASGRAPIRGRGKYRRYRINIAAAADWTFATGFDYEEFSASGGLR